MLVSVDVTAVFLGGLGEELHTESEWLTVSFGRKEQAMQDGPATDDGEEPVRHLCDTDGGTATEHAVADGTGPMGETIQMAGDGRNAGASAAADGQTTYWITGRHSGTEPVELQAALSLTE